jgi:hypothetical protein
MAPKNLDRFEEEKTLPYSFFEATLPVLNFKDVSVSRWKIIERFYDIA